MDPRLIEDMRHQALALSEEAVPFLEAQATAVDRKSEAGLRRTAAQTWLTTLLMEAVAWLTVRGGPGPHRRAIRLTASVAPTEIADAGDLDPALADLVRRVLTFHRRLEQLERRADGEPLDDPGSCTAAPAPVVPPFDVPASS